MGQGTFIASQGKKAWLAGEPMASKNDLGDGEVSDRPTMKRVEKAALCCALQWLQLNSLENEYHSITLRTARICAGTGHQPVQRQARNACQEVAVGVVPAGHGCGLRQRAQRAGGSRASRQPGQGASAGVLGENVRTCSACAAGARAALAAGAAPPGCKRGSSFLDSAKQHFAAPLLQATRNTESDPSCR
jgi:hypothetical protein